MIAQRTFKKAYADTLADNAKMGYGLELYGMESFPYDPDEVVIIPTLRHPEGLLKKLKPVSTADCESAIAIYEAYPNLTPLQASDRTFWIYLAHVDLFSYVQARYPKVLESGFNDETYVVNHWFTPKEWTSRHPLASLWWFVHQTIDESSDDKYKYTRFFFSFYDFRSNLLNYSIARHKEAVFGYFDFLMENHDVTAQNFQARNRFVTKYLNKLGGSRLLSTLPRSFFKEELTRLKPQILAVLSNSLDDEKDDDFDEE